VKNCETRNCGDTRWNLIATIFSLNVFIHESIGLYVWLSFFAFIVVNKITVEPSTPTIINGGVMKLSGPNFSYYQKVACVFADKDGSVTGGGQNSISGIVADGKAVCPMPLFRRLGKHNLTVLVDGKRYSGTFNVGKKFMSSAMYMDNIRNCLLLV